MNLVKDLQNGVTTLDKLQEELGIKVKLYDDRIVLTYDQIESPKAHPYVLQARGLILDKAFNVLCQPFDRFFNFGEVYDHEQMINWDKAECYEKVDGSLIKIYYDGSLWQIATRGTAFAESSVGGFPLTFQQLVLKALALSFEDFQVLSNKVLTKGYTYLFDVTSRENRVVTHYEGYKLWYLATRCNKTGEYLRTEKAVQQLGAQLINVFKFKSSQNCLGTAAQLPDLQEGYVVYQDGRPICKVKSPAYVTVHHLRGEGLSPKRIATLVLGNEQQEYLKYFPEDAGYILPYEEALKNIEQQLEEISKDVYDIESQKDFALEVKGLPFSAVLFQWRKVGGSITAVLHQQPLNYKLKLLLSYLGEKDE